MYIGQVVMHADMVCRTLCCGLILSIVYYSPRGPGSATDRSQTGAKDPNDSDPVSFTAGGATPLRNLQHPAKHPP